VSDTIIRQANESDISAVCQLQQQWFEEGSYYGFRPEGRKQFQAALGPYFLVAELDGAVIGFIAASIHTSEGTAVMEAGDSYIEIDNLYMSPPFRNQGIGSQLVTQLLSYAKEQGVAHALLCSANKDIPRIIKFYEQHNFKSWYVKLFQKL